MFALTALGCAAKNHDDALRGTAGSLAGNPERPLEVLVTNDAETLDPRYASDALGVRITRLLHAELVELDPVSLAPKPYVAESFEWIDPLTLRVTLRAGLRFHSGAPCTSRDVVATLRAYASPKVASRHARQLDEIAQVDGDGPLSVILHLRRPHRTLLTDLDLPILRFDEATSAPAPDGSLDALGPFVVQRVERGQIDLAPADFSAGPRPRHAVTIRTVHDENARALRLLAGRADVAVNAISPVLFPALTGKTTLAVGAQPGADLTYLVVRADRTPFSDVRLRRAVSLSIDRAGLANSLFYGRAAPADTVISPAHWAHTDFPPLVFDRDAARALVNRASPSPVHATLLTSTDRFRGTVARVLAQELGDVGIDLDVVPLELGTLLARLGAGDFDAAILQIPEMQEPYVLRVFLDSSFIPPHGSNRGRVNIPELDALFARADSMPSDEEAKRAYADLERLIREELPIIPLWHEDQVAITSARARFFSPSADGRWSSLAEAE